VQRLAVARRAADLLDRKLRVLAAELERTRATAERTGREWDTACREAGDHAEVSDVLGQILLVVQARWRSLSVTAW
jgi:hypothetical protein